MNYLYKRLIIIAPLLLLLGACSTKVENAEKSASKENICAAVNQLEAFKNQIEAKRGNPLSDVVADKIIQYTNNIIFKLLVKLPEGESCT